MNRILISNTLLIALISLTLWGCTLVVISDDLPEPADVEVVAE